VKTIDASHPAGETVFPFLPAAKSSTSTFSVFSVVSCSFLLPFSGSAVFGAFGKLGAADTFLSGFRPALGVVGALALLASVTALGVTSGPWGRISSFQGHEHAQALE
jgi:hypothetical protein